MAAASPDTSNPDTNDGQTSETKERKEQFQQEIQQRSVQIEQKIASIDNVDENDFDNRLILENEKEQLIQQQIATLKQMAALDPTDENVQREIEAQETQLAISENTIVEIKESQTLAAASPDTSNPDTNDGQSSQSEQTKVERELMAVKESYNLSGDIVTLDKKSSENLMRVQRYETALENMLEDEDWNADERSSIENELAKVSSWLDSTVDESASTEGNEVANQSLEGSSNVNSNRAILEKTNTIVSEENDFARERADEILTKKIENEELFVALESVESGREEKKIVKQIEKNDKEILGNQYLLIVGERDDYERVVRDIDASIDATLKNDPLIKSEFLILQQKLNQAQEVVDVLAASNRSDRERILVQAKDKRDDFIKQMSLLKAQIKTQQEINQVVQKTGIDESILTDSRKLEYAVININDEIEFTKNEIEFLQRNLSSYAKSEQPQIELDIEALELHQKEMQVLKKETQRKIQQRKTLVATIKDVPELTNNATDQEVLAQLKEEDVVALLNDQNFLSLRNDLVSFRMLEVRMQNAVNNQKSTRHEMNALINKIANEQDEAAKSDMRERLMLLADDYKSSEENIQALETEMFRLKNAIDANDSYQKDPVFYNSIASSPKFQDVILTLSRTVGSPVNEAGISPIQIGGITIVNTDDRSNATPDLALNPVSITGMVYKIQIGAFNRPIDMASFAEFDPITTDQVGNSIRYSAGLFYNKNQAFSSLNPIKAMGYRDAFVVAYCDGVRYSVAEADELLRQGKCSLNNAAQMAFETNTTKELDYNRSTNAVQALALEATQGLLFSVQIGVFNTPRTAELLQNLEPLNTQLTEKNQIRYSIGRFDDVQAAVRQRDQVRTLGFNDAFIVAYYNGEKVSVNEARNILETQGEVALFNRQQIKPVEIADLSTTNFVQDSTEQIELLDAFDLEYRLVSKSSFSKIPKDLIEKFRADNVWVFYDEQLSRIVSSSVSSDSEASNDVFEIQPIYQGFTVKDTAQITYQNLEGYQPESSYYTLILTWDKELPALVAYVLHQNLSYSISEWMPETKQLKFAPLNFVQKEQIRKSLMSFGGISLTESVLTF